MKKSNEIKRIKEIPSAYTHPTNHSPSIIAQDSSNRFVTDTEKSTWNGKVTQTDINNSINAIEIGGRNLLLNSEIEYTVVNSSMINENHIPNQYSATLIPSTQYTLSFDLYADNKVLSVDSHFVANFGEYKSKSYTNTNGIYARRIFTFTTGSNENGSGYIRFDNNGSTDGSLATLKVRRVKLEKGNKATDWTPAPEDVDSKIATKVTQTDIDNSINEIQIGGRNLLINSANIKITDIEYDWYTQSAIIGGADCTVVKYPKLRLSSRWLEGDLSDISITNLKSGQLTLSIDFKTNKSDILNFNLLVRKSPNTNSYSSNAITIPNTNNEWKRFYTVMNMPTDEIVRDSIICNIRGTTNTDINDTFSYRNIKLEKGNKATDWTPAPEDINAIEVGGRNLIILSKLRITFPYNETLTITNGVISTVRKKTEETISMEMAGWIPENREYTLSGIMKKNGAPVTNAMWTKRFASGSSVSTQYFYVDDVTGKFVITETYRGSNPLILQAYIIFDVGDVITIENFKMEKGNKATDWTPAVEDVDSAIALKADKITSGITSDRPIPTHIGQSHFDTTLGKPIWCKTVATPVWVDSTGTVV